MGDQDPDDAAPEYRPVPGRLLLSGQLFVEVCNLQYGRQIQPSVNILI